ncbi:carbon catabolite repressor protein 4 homolog 3 [Arachis duranensis]|uniref:Carbon catabolite repressor protein 4 homolog 3 n=1 Tax=Arachis duranensis TaxID=130453 RepID=A0A6P4CN59_ARADU|nr:carbon catabolite repressor protein 4 homolog 3 [Arachis duranensis]
MASSAPPSSSFFVSSSSTTKRPPFFFAPTSFKFYAPTASDSNSSSSSSSLSSTRRWFNPLRRRKFDQPPQIERHWVEAPHQPLASSERFSVASYNILADRNASQHRDLYVNVPSYYVNWDRRKRVICKELLGWDTDIICLQEVDKYIELSNILVKAGYTGSYKRRTGDTADGCAMFWKADKFRLLESESIQFKDMGLRDNVAQLLVFEMCEFDSRRLLVGNIHVLYNPNRGEVKLGQIRFLLARAKALSEKWGNSPIVLAGDFNSTPQSGIYKFLSSSELNIMLYDRKELSGQKRCRPAQVLGKKKETVGPFILLDGLLNCWTDEEVKVATGDSGCHSAVHPLKLNSSYAAIDGSTSTRGFNGEPFATSYHSKFLGTVDYLWYSDGILPTKVLDTVSIGDLVRTGGLPCKKVGSDHLALVSEFSFLDANNASTEIVAASASPRLDNEEQDKLQS